MYYEKIALHVNDATSTDGECIQFGFNDCDLFFNLAKATYSNKKKITVFRGKIVGDINVFGRLEHAHVDNYEVESIESLSDTPLSFVAIDVTDTTIKMSLVDILDYIWRNISYGGSILINKFRLPIKTNTDNAVKRFIDSHKNEITTSRQMLINGKRERCLIIKCFNHEKRPSIKTSSSTLTIATVLKTGKEYTPFYVNHIANAIKEYSTIDYKFVCLTDAKSGFNNNVNSIIPLQLNLPGWWSKMELFRPDVFDTERVMYFDLDTLIVDNIDHILNSNEDFLYLRDFYTQIGMASGIMSWVNNNPRIYQIYAKFMESPESHMKNFHGDQDFISSVIDKWGGYLQDMFPSEIISYKKDCVGASNEISIPVGSKIICFHGKPRPHQVNLPKVKKFWFGG